MDKGKGRDIITLPEGSMNVNFVKADGKFYMMLSIHVAGEDQTIIYSLDNLCQSIRVQKVLLFSRVERNTLTDNKKEDQAMGQTE